MDHVVEVLWIYTTVTFDGRLRVRGYLHYYWIGFDRRFSDDSIGSLTTDAVRVRPGYGTLVFTSASKKASKMGHDDFGIIWKMYAPNRVTAKKLGLKLNGKISSGLHE